MTDYLSELEDQLGRVVELGVHNRSRFAGRLPRSGTALLAGAASIFAVVICLAVLLGGGRSARAPVGSAHAHGAHPTQGAEYGDLLDASGAHRTGARRGSYCVNSATHLRTPCSARIGSPATSGGQPVTGPPRGAPVTLVSQVNLTAPSGASRPIAVAQVGERRRVFEIDIAGAGLVPNTSHDVYALWLSNGRRGHKLVGFVDHQVTANGRLKTHGDLPPHPFRYHLLLITLERHARPSAPGTIVLEGRLHR